MTPIIQGALGFVGESAFGVQAMGVER